MFYFLYASFPLPVFIGMTVAYILLFLVLAAGFIYGLANETGQGVAAGLCGCALLISTAVYVAFLVAGAQ